ncbi:hypothetical protein KKA85_09460, partial [bacterium]|nr:hypothetical protein [bacterium]
MIALALALILVALAIAAYASSRQARARGARPLGRTGAHYRRCYGRRGFLRLGLAGGAAAVLAHTRIDEIVDGWHAEAVRSPATDRAADVFRPCGERFWFFYWAAFAAADAWSGSSALTRWGRSAFEALVVGLPALWTIQRVAGASRPSDPPATSHWRPLADDNSASGHTFMAA